MCRTPPALISPISIDAANVATAASLAQVCVLVWTGGKRSWHRQELLHHGHLNCITAVQTRLSDGICFHAYRRVSKLERALEPRAATRRAAQAFQWPASWPRGVRAAELPLTSLRSRTWTSSPPRCFYSSPCLMSCKTHCGLRGWAGIKWRQ